MRRNSAKAELYHRATVIREELGIKRREPVVSSVDILNRLPFLAIESQPFRTRALHGVCSFGRDGDIDVIVLSSHRTAIEQNFDCMHEYFHLHEHRNEKKDAFYCYENVQSKQNRFLEWQANEGAAEILMPYKEFIPLFLHFHKYQKTDRYFPLIDALAACYCVTTAMVENRIRSLSYEIYQYEKGCPLDQIELLSGNQQQKRNIVSPDYLARCTFPMGWNDYIG